jgi:plasmid stability protein
MHEKECTLNTMTIRNIDDELKARLRIRAAERGHSMEAEVREILRAAVLQPAPEKGLGTWMHEHFAEIGGVELDTPKPNSPARYVEFPE